jgi:ferredoxin
MLPYREADTAEWPIRISELAEHYSEAAALTGLSAVHDDLAQHFPVYAARPTALNLSRQAAALMQRLERCRSKLGNAGVYFGQARVAVQASDSAQPEGCVYCGVCMYGCPYGYIYNSETTLRQLQRQPTFSYCPGIIVTRLREVPGRVLVEGYYRVDGRPFAASVDRVYLAAYDSIDANPPALTNLFGHTVWMKDSQHSCFRWS